MKRSKSEIENHPQDGDVDDSNAVQRQQQEEDIGRNDGENMFSKAVLNLSFNDRNTFEEEMHGVSCMAIEETPELIEESLYQFDLELDLIEHKVAYNKAQEIVTSKEEDPLTRSFILSKEVKLRFLRSELFDPSKSALRYTKYLDLLYEIYGECSLRRPIRLQDLNREELSFLKSGEYQLLPYRDRSGRRILVDVTNSKLRAPRKVFLKVALYVNFACIGGSDTCNNDRNNVETQCKGIVVVCLPNVLDEYDSKENDNQNNDKQSMAQWSMERVEANALIEKVVPLRVAAVHICLPNSHKFKVLASVLGIVSKASNARTKIHLGNPIEIRYKLQQYGIPSELIPKTDTGNVKSVNLKQWIKLRTHLELEEQIHMININKSTPVSDINNSGCDSEVLSTISPQLGLHCLADKNNINVVECPLWNDVIFRRGKTMNVHSGNTKFQNLIESHIHEHSIDLNTTPLRRKEIEIDLMNEVQKPEKKNGCGGYSSGRFLTWDIKNHWWLVIHSDDEIEAKIHYAFRDFRKKMLRTKQQQQKVQTITNLNSLFEQQQNGQKKKRYVNNKNSGCSDFVSNNGCNIMPCLPSMNNNGNNNNACGYFFSTDDGSYAYLNDGRLSSP